MACDRENEKGSNVGKVPSCGKEVLGLGPSRRSREGKNGHSPPKAADDSSKWEETREPCRSGVEKRRLAGGGDGRQEQGQGDARSDLGLHLTSCLRKENARHSLPAQDDFSFLQGEELGIEPRASPMPGEHPTPKPAPALVIALQYNSGPSLPWGSITSSRSVTKGGSACRIQLPPSIGLH